jgi:hypothetical protein
MSGDLFEWCWDWYGRDYYTSSPDSDPLGVSRTADNHPVGVCPRATQWKLAREGGERANGFPQLRHSILCGRQRLPPGADGEALRRGSVGGLSC